MGKKLIGVSDLSMDIWASKPIVSVIISLCNNRIEHFKRSLITYNKQNFDKKDFEVLLIDDAERNEYIDLISEIHDETGLQFRYIQIDPAKGKYPAKSFTPALTNNVGFRKAKGDVVVICGPETMWSEDNIKIASEMVDRQECAYGLVYRAGPKFNKWIEKNSFFLDLSFDHILAHGDDATAECRTKPPHPPAYHYFMAVAKKYVEVIRGYDERMLEGICGDDDDFSNRMKFSGIEPVFDHRMMGIHQDHSKGDQEDEIHKTRWNEKWQKLRQINLNYMNENIRNRDFVANKNHEWGDPNTIIKEREWLD